MHGCTESGHVQRGPRWRGGVDIRLTQSGVELAGRASHGHSLNPRLTVHQLRDLEPSLSLSFFVINKRYITK